jgi:hypothetical protein
MSNITYFNRKNDRYYFHGPKQISSISIEDRYGNKAYTSGLNDDIYSNFLNINFDVSVNSGLMPPGVRAIYPGIVVFERPPRMQIVQYIPMSIDGIVEYESEEDEYPEVQSYYIPIPWQIYIASYTSANGQMLLNGVKMFFSKEPLAHPNVELYLPYLLNFFTNGNLCAPHFEDSDEIYRYPKNISGVVASAYDWVWNTGFNQDLIDGVMTNINSQTLNPVVRYVRENPSHDLIHTFYSKLSEYTPEDIISFDWASPSYTTYYDTTTEINYLYTLSSLQNLYVEENQIDLEEYSFDQVVSHSEFCEWLGNHYRIKKTYSDIMNSVLFDKENKSERTANHRVSFNNANRIFPQQEMFLSMMLAYVSRLPN